jgi:hypothetical protein
MYKKIIYINDHNSDSGFTYLDHLGQYGKNRCNPVFAVLSKVTKESKSAVAVAGSFTNKCTNCHEP